MTKDKGLNKYFDHTLLKPEATEKQVEKLCQEALKYDFFSVCVNSAYVPLALSILKGSDVKVAAVVGFPLGTCTTETKVFETDQVCSLGAAEVDMVLNVGMMKEKNYAYVEKDIAAIVDAAAKYSSTVKVILETCLLEKDEITKACEIAKKAGAAFVKTSTGFNSGGATVEDVKLMKKTVGDNVQVKASGGIRDYETTMKMIEAGADRIGCSSGVEIMKSLKL